MDPLKNYFTRVAARTGPLDLWRLSRRARLVLAVVIVVSAVALPSSATASATHRYIVLLDVAPAHVQTILEVQSRSLKFLPAMIYQHAIAGYAADLNAAQVAALRVDPLVSAIGRDARMTLAAQTTPTGVDRIDADRNAHANIDSVDERIDADIAIIDAGVAPNPDLNIVARMDCTVVGACTETPPSAWDKHDRDGHGTAVAGIAAAIDNDTEFAGVAPGARLHSLKTDLSVTAIIGALDWVFLHADTIDVVNMSFGIKRVLVNSVVLDAMHLAIQNVMRRGVAMTVAAGNQSADVFGGDGPGGGNDFEPAAYPEVLTVSALDDADGKSGGDSFASFSNYGAAVDMIAPGVNLESTPLPMYGGEFVPTWNGTSFSAPHAAGVIALYIAENGRATDAAGVQRIYEAVIAAGQPQDGPHGISGDPDGFPEPVVWATGPVFGNTRPDAGFDYSCRDLTCTFTSASSDDDGQIAEELWDFGDGITGTGPVVEHTFPSAGGYRVSLAVIDDEGAFSSATQTVEVTEGQPKNIPPSADFTFTCSDAACSFTDGSSDADGAIAAWQWSFGDGTGDDVQNATHRYTAAGEYTVTLTVTDDRGATASIARAVMVTAPVIELSGSGYKVQGVKHVDLSWAGASGASIVIYRDGIQIAVTGNDGAFTDNLGERGRARSISYQICEASSSFCSKTVMVEV